MAKLRHTECAYYFYVYLSLDLTIDPDRTTKRARYHAMAFRTANDDEAAALIFTFGDWMGKKLIDYIEIGTGEGESEKQKEVLLDKAYKSADLYYLGVFIRKATRVWQKLVERYHQRKGDGDYNYRDLYVLNKLNSKQHARAVRDWFWVNYGSAAHLIGTGSRQLTIEYLLDRIIPVLGVNPQNKDRFGRGVLGGQEAALRYITDNHYACVIRDLRDYS